MANGLIGDCSRPSHYQYHHHHQNHGQNRDIESGKGVREGARDWGMPPYMPSSQLDLEGDLESGREGDERKNEDGRETELRR